MKLFGNTGNGKRTRPNIRWDDASPEKAESKQEEPEVNIYEKVTERSSEKPTPKEATRALNEMQNLAPEQDEKKPEENAQPISNSGKTKGIVLLVVSAAIFLITVFAVAFQYIKVDKTEPAAPQQTVPTEIHLPTQTEEPAVTEEQVTYKGKAPASETEGVYNILLVGIDDEDKYTDTVMMFHVNLNTNQLAAFSLPHNTLVYGDYDIPMLDEIYNAEGKNDEGLDALEDKLESMIGFPADARIVITADTLRDVLMQVGNVNVDVPEDISSTLMKGDRELSPAELIQLLQTKKFKDETIRRERIQLDFLHAFGVQKLPALSEDEVEELAEKMKNSFDTELTAENILYLLTEIRKCDFSMMKSYLMPGRTINYYDRKYHQLDESAILAIINMSFNPYEDEIDSKDIDIRTEQETGVPNSDFNPSHNDDDDDDEENQGGTNDPDPTEPSGTGETDPDPTEGSTPPSENE